MTFHHPWFLLLALAVPLLVWLRFGRGRHISVRFGDGRSLYSIPPSPAIRLLPLLPVLYTAGLLLLVVAIARPQKGLDESIVRTEAVDIVLLVDLSPSMRALDFSTPRERINRLDAARKTINEFVKSRESDRIGIVAFASLPYSVAPLTMDHAWILQQLERLQPGDLGDGTAIGTGIGSAVNRLRESKAKSKLIVLLTDGANNMGDLSPVNAAQAAKALGIKIYTIGAAKEGMVPMPVATPWGERTQMVPSDIDEGTLKEIANITGATFFRAEDLATLGKIYEQIDAMEKTEIEVEQYTHFEERFSPWLWAAITCLLLEKLLSLTRLGRLP